VKARQIHARLWYKGRQLGDEVQGFEYDMGSSVAVRCLELVADITLRGQCQTLLRHRRAADVPANPLQFVALVSLSRYPCVQREPRLLSHSV
jgi:hypothetical protein